jgi:SAM-dependent methyltransferase
MPVVEPLLPTTARLAAAAEALGALAAHLRVESEGLDVDERLRSLLAEIAAELLGPAAAVEPGASAQAVGMAQAFLRESVSLVSDPGRAGPWKVEDAMVLEGLGRLSMAIASAFQIAAGRLDGLGDALAQPTAAFLDVGTGTGWLAIATARAFPAARVLGIDVFELALERARRNVSEQGLADRVDLRHVDLADLVDADPDARFDATWLPMPFLAREFVAEAIRAANATLKPGGWLLLGTFAGADDRLSRLLTDLRIVRSGGHPWDTPEVLAMLEAAGLTDAQELDRSWPAPLRLWVARRPC